MGASGELCERDTPEREHEMQSKEYKTGYGHGMNEGHDWSTEMSMDGWNVSKGDAEDHAGDQVRHLAPDGPEARHPDWADGWYSGFVAGATK